MKNGKLFGKINIIDLLVILVVAAAAVILALRLAGREEQQPTSAASGERIRYEVRVSRVSPEVWENVKSWYEKGENQLIAGSEFIDGRIVDLYAVPYRTTVTTSEGQIVEAEDPMYKTLFFTIEAALTDRTTMRVVSQETRVGLNNVVKTLGFCFTNGTILSVEFID